MLPKLSVLLPVYNVAPYIRATIDSILTQTFSDFELIIIDDVSTDNTVEVIQQVADPRVKLIQNSVNKGRAGSDMAGLQHVRGQYIAKMDGDDLCQPDRFALQVDILDKHPEINIVGSWMQNFGASTYCNRYPEQPADTQVFTLFTLPTGNPSVMMRASLFSEQGMYYDTSLRQTEDYDFFVRYIRQIKLYNIQESLIQYRVLAKANQKKQAILSERSSVSDEVRAAFLKDWGFPADAQSQFIFNLVSMLDKPLGSLTHASVERWLQALIRHNEQFPLFEPAALKRGLSKRWFEFCYNYPLPYAKNWLHFKRSSLASYFPPTHFQKWKFIASSFMKPVRQ